MCPINLSAAHIHVFSVTFADQILRLAPDSLDYVYLM